MVEIVPIKRIYQRLLVRALMHPRVHYRPLILMCETTTPDFSYEILEILFKIIVEESWMVNGYKTYRDALAQLDQLVKSHKEPVLDGYFISVWPKTRDILVRDLTILKKAAAS